jgi:hypothetical protein
MAISEGPVRVWERQDIRLLAEGRHANPYAEVTVWVDLEGPGFAKRVYGFWDGGQEFCVRVLATAPGTWRWRSGGEPHDPGLAGRSGSFVAHPWSEAELAENPNRHGMVVTSRDGRGLEYADGTPFFLLGDTWWSVPSFRFPLGPAKGGPVGPDSTLEDYVLLRKAQGFNCVGIIAAHPAWAKDGHPARRLRTNDGTWIRHGWETPGTDTCKDMHNEGGRPFLFPGKAPGFEEVLPDLDRINPEYWRVLDAKMDLLNAHGFVPFLEAARRDTAAAWQRWHDWPDSYIRYVQYVFARYHAHICILSPIHYDHFDYTIPARDYNASCNGLVERYGRPPFGNLLSANSNPSTLTNFGGHADAPWIDLHQTGNTREHHSYWWLTEIHRQQPPKPALNGEPYYAGLHELGEPYPLRVADDGPDDQAYVRSGIYGSFLSGGLAGHIYGAEGIWQAAVEPESLVTMWDAFRWRSADQVRHLRSFAFVRGLRFRELVPEAELVIPNKEGPPIAYDGWSYAAATPARDLVLLYFERKTSTRKHLRGSVQGARYRASWFDPRTGEWSAPGEPLTVQPNSLLPLPPMPDDQDWGMMLERMD